MGQIGPDSNRFELYQSMYQKRDMSLVGLEVRPHSISLELGMQWVVSG